MVLFGSKHEYRQDQGSGGEHLNKNTLRRVDTHCQVRTVRTKKLKIKNGHGSFEDDAS